MGRLTKESLWMLGCLCSSTMFYQRIGSPSLGGGTVKTELLVHDRASNESVEDFAVRR